MRTEVFRQKAIWLGSTSRDMYDDIRLMLAALGEMVLVCLEMIAALWQLLFALALLVVFGSIAWTVLVVVLG